MVVRWFEISAVRRIVLGKLFGLSQGSRFIGSWLSLICTVFHFISTPLFSDLKNNCVKGLSLLLETLAAKDT